MPCRDYSDSDLLAQETGRANRLKERLDLATKLLCKLCRAHFNADKKVIMLNTALGTAFRNPLLVEWWKRHEKDDDKRIADEMKLAAAQIDEEQRKRIARAALKKLSPTERRALGITSGKRV